MNRSFLLSLTIVTLVYQFLTGINGDPQLEDFANNLSGALLKLFEETVNYDYLSREFKSEFDGSQLHELHMSQIQRLADEYKMATDSFMAKHIVALQNIVEAAEQQLLNVTFGQVYHPSETFYHKLINLTEDRIFNASGIHIPVDVFEEDNDVLRDISWTESLNEVFEQNSKLGLSALRQYVSLNTGVTRIFPALATFWKLEPAGYTVDLFDPRMRPWYIGASVPPKDVLIMIDSSGSVYGRTNRMIKMTVLSILSTLNSNDYVSLVWYNKEVHQVFHPSLTEKANPHTDCEIGFIQATSKNKLLLQRKINQVHVENEAELKLAMLYAKQMFADHENATESSKVNFGAGGQPILMILSDGAEQYDEGVLHLFAENMFGEKNMSMQVFGFAMDIWPGDILPLKWITCMSHGRYAEIPYLENIKQAVMGYLPHLNQPLVLKAIETPVRDRQVTFTGPYMDAQNNGAIITISMPILDSMNSSNSTNLTFAGVAAIDIKISELQQLWPIDQTSDKLKVFATDNNGNLLFHSNYRFPENEFYLIRRTSCSLIKKPENQLLSKKVLFNDPDELIFQQMGYIDSIISQDLLEIEGDTNTLRTLREDMIDQKCGDSRYESETFSILSDTQAIKRPYEYLCRSIANTTISVAIAIELHHHIKQLNVSPPTKNASIGDFQFLQRYADVILSPRYLCNTDLSRLASENRSVAAMEEFETSSICKTNTTRSNLIHMKKDLSVLRSWINWLLLSIDSSYQYSEDLYVSQTLSDNQTCWLANDNSTNKTVFAQTFGGLTVVFPCTLNVHENLKTDAVKSRYFKTASELHNKLIFDAADKNLSVAAYRIIKYDTIPLAVVGTFLNIVHMQASWKNLSLTDENFDLGINFDHICSNTKDNLCHLIDNTGRVLASTDTRIYQFHSKVQHIGDLYPILVQHLFNTSIFKQFAYKDTQGVCKLEGGNYFISGAMRSVAFLFSFINTFVQWIVQLCSYEIWWTAYMQLRSNWGTFASNVTDDIDELPPCELTASKQQESCIIQRNYTSIHLHSPTEGTVRSRYCKLHYHLMPINHTNLFLLQTNSTCESCAVSHGLHCKPHFTLEERVVEMCNDVRNRIWYRKRVHEPYEYIPMTEGLNVTCSGNSVKAEFTVLTVAIAYLPFANLL